MRDYAKLPPWLALVGVVVGVVKSNTRRRKRLGAQTTTPRVELKWRSGGECVRHRKLGKALPEGS
jgi:hypothetical protein